MKTKQQCIEPTSRIFGRIFWIGDLIMFIFLFVLHDFFGGIVGLILVTFEVFLLCSFGVMIYLNFCQLFFFSYVLRLCRYVCIYVFYMQFFSIQYCRNREITHNTHQTIGNNYKTNTMNNKFTAKLLTGWLTGRLLTKQHKE